ncbi:MAG: tRNA preQ1(34) S-adenosylmethionine ribosyltransferase-isomerase QueA [candidate division WOR-3 bacterium]
MLSLSLFDYNLPPDLIAQRPMKERDNARMLVINLKDERIVHSRFYELPNFLKTGDVLVLNKTKVLKARVYVEAEDTGGKLEILYVESVSNKEFKALVSEKRKVKEGRVFKAGKDRVRVREIEKDKVIFEIITDSDVFSFLNEYGVVPLPPYIRRKPDEYDENYYQTVFAERGFSVAAPTAGLHFTQRVLKELENKGISIVPIYLHVGTGTFKPVKVDDVTKHKMDPEYFEIPEATAKVIKTAKEQGRRIIACGTTSVRTLEHWRFDDSKMSGLTDLFIYPGFEFKVVDGLITNFHLPKSTPLILVSAFAGRERILKAYEEAIREQYRFLSYGDAMLILPEID